MIDWTKIAADNFLAGVRCLKAASKAPVNRPAHLRYVASPDAINRADLLGEAEFNFGMARLYRNRAKQQAAA